MPFPWAKLLSLRCGSREEIYPDWLEVSSILSSGWEMQLKLIQQDLGSSVKACERGKAVKQDIQSLLQHTHRSPGFRDRH